MLITYIYKLSVQVNCMSYLIRLINEHFFATVKLFYKHELAVNYGIFHCFLPKILTFMTNLKLFDLLFLVDLLEYNCWIINFELYLIIIIVS